MDVLKSCSMWHFTTKGACSAQMQHPQVTPQVNRGNMTNDRSVCWDATFQQSLECLVRLCLPQLNINQFTSTLLTLNLNKRQSMCCPFSLAVTVVGVIVGLTDQITNKLMWLMTESHIIDRRQTALCSEASDDTACSFCVVLTADEHRQGIQINCL